VVFFDTSMLSEAPSGATPACAAAELVRLAAGPDFAFETRRRGARWRTRAGLFASPVSTFAPLFVRVPVERDHRFRWNVIIGSGDRDQAEMRV
jgi:hypothetical protein